MTSPALWQYSIHDLVRIRTSVPIPTLPAYFLREEVTPDLEIDRVEHIDLPRERIRAEVGYTVFDLGDGEVVYDTDVPIMYLLGLKARWRIKIGGLTEGRTQVLTSAPFFGWRPVGFKVTELLSRLTQFILILKLLDRGLAMCHATTLAKDGRAFLLFGYSGTGKSTLAAKMLQEGFQYMSEDFTLVDGEGRVYCYPDMPPPRSRLPRVPLARYVRGTFMDRGLQADVCDRATADSILILEKGSDRVEDLSTEETLRRLTLLNLEELSKLWNSPISVLLNHYAYFYPTLDLPGIVDRYTRTVASFVDRVGRRERVRSSSPRFEVLQDRLRSAGRGGSG